MNPGRNLMFLPGFFFFVAFGVLLYFTKTSRYLLADQKSCDVKRNVPVLLLFPLLHQ